MQRKAVREYLSGVKLSGWGRFFRYLVAQFVRDQGMLSAAALTYTTLFAVVPLMTVTYAMLASIPSFQGVSGQLEALIFDHFVPASGVAVREYLSQFASQARALTAIGVGFLVVTAYMMLKSIEGAFNRIWGVSEPRRGLSSFLLYWAVLSLGPLLLGLGFIVTSYIVSLPMITDATAVLGGRERFLALLPLVLSSAAFTLIYAAVPNCTVPLRHALVGGVVVACLFEAAKRGFSLFVTQFPSYELIYGAFAAFPLFLAWVYISWLIVLVGAELVRALGVYRDGGEQQAPVPLLVMLDLLFSLWQAQKRGESLDQRQLMLAIPGLDKGSWDLVMPLLRRHAMIEQTTAGRFLLTRDLGEVQLWALCKQLPWPLPAAEQLEEQHRWHSVLRQRLAEAEQASESALQVDLSSLFTSVTNTENFPASKTPEANSSDTSPSEKESL